MNAGYVMAPAGYQSDIAVLSGPRLLSGIDQGGTLAAHRITWAEPPPQDTGELLDALRQARLRGRGGAGFPFERKLTTTMESGRKRELVVNASETEPASAKDSALMTVAPHLVLDGAEIVARALKVRTVRVVVSGDRPAVQRSVASAISERDGVRFEIHHSTGGFVGGQARAVIELLEGRENLPVTAWQPEAVSGLRGRPTLVSNAETFAQVAALCAVGPATYCRAGTPAEPGTMLVTVAGDVPGGVVLEVPHGEPLAVILHRCGYGARTPVLIGGYHGSWLPAEETARRRVSREDLEPLGASVGAGVVLPLDPNSCPVVLTARIVEYLAGQSARRCGPCMFGLAGLADATLRLATTGGRPATVRIREVAGLVSDRGACSHPEGTSRLVRSMLTAFGEEVTAHEHGECRLGSLPGALGAVAR